MDGSSNNERLSLSLSIYRKGPENTYRVHGNTSVFCDHTPKPYRPSLPDGRRRHQPDKPIGRTGNFNRARQKRLLSITGFPSCNQAETRRRSIFGPQTLETGPDYRCRVRKNSSRNILFPPGLAVSMSTPPAPEMARCFTDTTSCFQGNRNRCHLDAHG